MKSKFINVIMFAAGAAIGSAVTWKIVKTKYERIAHEEIESVKEAFSDLLAIRPEEVSEETNESDDDQRRSKQIDWSEYEDLEESEEEPDPVTIAEYERLANNYTNKKGGAENMAKEPYVISPYDFGENDEYHQVELTYYADGTLEDEDYNIITDVDELIGAGSLYTFGEYEDDAVFVRNERLSTDFQILKDYRSYSEARSVGPKQVDDE